MTTWYDVGGNPAPGQPYQIRGAANHLGELATNARYARQQLAALQRGELRACWTGVAADAFAAELEKLPADLGKLERSLDHASTAVHRWAGTVEHFQQVAESQLRTYDRASHELRDARADLERERLAQLEDSVSDPIGGIADLLTGNERLRPFEDRVDDARIRVRRTRDEIEDIRDQVDAIARQTAALLEQASRLGIQNKGFFEKAGEFLKELGEALLPILKFLDELVDMLAPWIGIALIVLSVVFPPSAAAFAIAGLVVAGLDFGLTASRMALGDDEVEMKHLLDDGIDLALALVGARSAGAGLGVVDDFGRAVKAADGAADAGKLYKAVDTTLDVIGVGKATADFYLNIGDVLGYGPGSTFNLVVDVAAGDTDKWVLYDPYELPSLDLPASGDSGGGPNPGGDMPGIDLPGEPPPSGDMPGGPNPGGDMPGIDLPGGPNPGGDMPGIDLPGEPPPSGDMPGGPNPGGDSAVLADFAAGESNQAASLADFTSDDTKHGQGLGDFASGDSDRASSVENLTSGDTGPSRGSAAGLDLSDPTPGDAMTGEPQGPPSGQAAEASASPVGESAAPVGGSSSSDDGEPSLGLIAAAAAGGVASTAAGAKRASDRRDAGQPEGDQHNDADTVAGDVRFTETADWAFDEGVVVARLDAPSDHTDESTSPTGADDE